MVYGNRKNTKIGFKGFSLHFLTCFSRKKLTGSLDEGSREGECFYNSSIYFFCMDIVFQFNQSWYVLFFAFLFLWLILLVSRKNHKGKRETKEQFYLAFGGLLTLLLMEIFATSTDLWHYIPGNWPIILWPTYFVAILFGYQLLRFIEGLFS